MKKILSIILIIAMLLSFAACNSSSEDIAPTPVPTVAPVQTAEPQETEAPEKTVAPTQTERPSDDYTYVLAKPVGGSSNDDDVTEETTIKLTLSTTTSATLEEEKDYIITLASSDASYEISGNTSANVTINGNATDITINTPNAHVEYTGTATAVYATTSDTTFETSADAKITNLTINGGNASLQGTIETTTIAAQDVVLTVKGETTVVNKGVGAVIIAEESAKLTVDTTAENAVSAYVQNKSTTATVAIKTTAATPITVPAGNEVYDTQAEIITPEEIPSNDASEYILGVLSANKTLSYGKTYTIGADFNAGEFTITNYGTIEVSTATELQHAVSIGGNIKMISDIQVTSSVRVLNVAVIDMNGYVVDAAEGDVTIFILNDNKSNLTLKSSNTVEKTYEDITYVGGLLTGSNSVGAGGAVKINNQAVLTIENITIAGNSAKTGAGISIASNGTLNMIGGEITANTTTSGAAGIATSGTGHTITFASDAKVYGNYIITQDEVAEAVNVWLADGATFNVEELQSGAKIYVSNKLVRTDAYTSSIEIVSNATSGDEEYIFNDNADYQIVFSNGTLQVVKAVLTFEELETALSYGGYILLANNIEIDVVGTESDSVAAMNVNVAGTVIDGNGFTLSAINAVTADGSFLNILKNDVTVKNITLDGGSITGLKHGINVYVSTGVAVENVTCKNFVATGMTVNGSTVVATDFNVSNSGWGSVNVAQGGGVTTLAKFTLLGNSNLQDAAQIYADITDLTDNVEVIADGYTMVYLTSDYSVSTDIKDSHNNKTYWTNQI